MTRREIRAVVLIAASMLAVVISGAVYLAVNSSTQPEIASAARVPMLASKYTVDFDFISASEGWALVTETKSDSDQISLYHTSDGAWHWQRQYVLSTAFGAPKLQFFDRRHGMISILSSPSQLYRTADGGLHWTVVTLPRSVVVFAFSDPLHGWLQTWLGGPGFGFRLFSTSDGGTTWSERNWPAGAAWGGQGRFGGEIEFRGSGEGWVGAYKSRPSVYSTHDDGRTWKGFVIPVPPDAFPPRTSPVRPAYPSFTTEVALLPGTGILAFVIDYFGDFRAFVSFDDGAGWRMLAPPAPGIQYSDYTFQDSTHWWAMRDATLYKTADAGRTWATVHSSAMASQWIYKPHVIDAHHAWAEMRSRGLDVYGTALALTSDGGLTWPAASVPRP